MFFAKAEITEKSVVQLEKLVSELQASNVDRSAEQRVVKRQNVALKLGREGVRSLVEQYRSGDSIETVAKAAGISASAARRVLLAEGVTMRLAPLPDSTVRRAATMYDAGMGVKAVADELQVSKTTLLRAMKAAGVVMRPPKH